jgi:hypothetical protein
MHPTECEYDCFARLIGDCPVRRIATVLLARLLVLAVVIVYYLELQHLSYRLEPVFFEAKRWKLLIVFFP